MATLPKPGTYLRRGPLGSCTHAGWRTPGSQTGTSALEFVGIVAAIAMLVAATAPAMSGGGASAAARIAGTLRAAVDGTVTLFERHGSDHRTVGIGDGAPHPRPSIDSGKPKYALIEARREFAADWGPFGYRGDVAGCAVCADWSHSLSSGIGPARGNGSRGKDRGADGLWALYDTGANVSLLRASTQHALGFENDYVDARLGVAGSAGVGGELSGSARLAVGRQRQELHLKGTTIAGATVRGEQDAAINFLGIAIRERAGVEGWAGAGATGAAHLSHEAGVFTIGGRGGGALGLGGAFDLEATIDTTGVAKSPVARALLSLPHARPEDLAQVIHQHTTDTIRRLDKD